MTLVATSPESTCVENQKNDRLDSRSSTIRTFTTSSSSAHEVKGWIYYHKENGQWIKCFGVVKNEFLIVFPIDIRISTAAPLFKIAVHFVKYDLPTQTFNIQDPHKESIDICLYHREDSSQWLNAFDQAKESTHVRLASQRKSSKSCQLKSSVKEFRKAHHAKYDQALTISKGYQVRSMVKHTIKWMWHKARK